MHLVVNLERNKGDSGSFLMWPSFLFVGAKAVL